MKHRLIFIATSFMALLSIHIFIFNNIKVYNIREIAGWTKNTSREISTYILPDENTTLIEPIEFCKTSTPIFLLIVVCSSPFNFEARETIRQTWGNTSVFNYESMFKRFHGKYNKSFLNVDESHMNDWIKFNEESNATIGSSRISHNLTTKVAFLVGTTISDEIQVQINYESDLYGDIIQENFVDSYNNLTLKTVLMLKWATRNCAGKAKYIMKCDDDTFVNVPNILHVLSGGTLPVYKSTILYYDRQSVNSLSPKNRLPISKNLLVGYKFCSAKPVSDVNSKWYAPGYLYQNYGNGEVYPDYLSGIGYIMSFDAAKKLYKGSLETPFFHLEDVYLTGFVAEKVKIKRLHHPLVFYLPSKDLCSVRGMLTHHNLSPLDIEVAYNFITNSSNVCFAPAKHFLLSKMKLTQRKRCQ